MPSKKLYYFLSFIFPLIINFKFKKIKRGIVIHLISAIIITFVMIFMKKIFETPNDILINLIFINIILLTMISLIIYDAIKIIKSYEN